MMENESIQSLRTRAENAEEKARYWHKRYDEEIGGGPWAQRTFAVQRELTGEKLKLAVLKKTLKRDYKGMDQCPYCLTDFARLHTIIEE